MDKLKTYAVGFAALAALFLLGSVMESRVARTNAATYSTPVTVLNTGANPVPTTAAQLGPWGVNVTNAGNSPVPVAGAVSAQQAGAWNVGISGTPQFNLVNPIASPGNVVDAESISRQPYNASQTTAQFANPGQCGNGPFNCHVNFCNVPTGHILVVTSISAVIQATTNPTLVISDGPAALGTPNRGVLPTSIVNGNAYTNGPVLMYFNSTPSVLAFGGSSSAPHGSDLTVYLSGYMINCSFLPGGTCPSIIGN